MSALSKAAMVAICISLGPAQAHEFWIEATDYAVPSGAAVEAGFRNGEEMSGSSLSFIPARSERFDMIMGGETRSVPARLGDNPAFTAADLPDGLLTILHETAEQRLTYTEWAKWVRFTDHKDFAFAQEAHRERGLSEERFVEAYRRFAKALVAVGDGVGSDTARGMRTEIVAGLNPYIDDLSAGLPVQVLLDGAPKPEAQVEMFARAPDGTVQVTLHRADADGRALLPVEAGHDYLLDSVSIEAVEPATEGDPVWLTLWAALTFAVPSA